MKTVILLFALFAFAVSSAAGQARSTQETLDGNWWLSYGKTTDGQIERMRYIQGIAKGLDIGLFILIASGAATPSEQERIQAFNLFSQSLTVNVSNRQLSDGLDALYGDFSNRRIAVTIGTWIVLNQIRGIDKSALEEMIQTSRRMASQ